MKEYSSENIRNVVLIAHGGAGKTSLGEAMLFNTGSIPRLGRVDDGTTTSDYDPDETRRKISINLSLLPLEWQGNKLNLIDTPGYADFVGEVKAGVRVANGAVVVICGVSGVEVGSELVWRYANEQALPRIVFVNKIDRENADFFRTLDQLRSQFGSKCCPIQLPIGAQEDFEGVIDLVGMKACVGDKAPEKDIPTQLVEQVNLWREKLLEAVAETDDDLLTKYLEGEELSEADILQGLRKGTLGGKIVPVLVGSALKNMAISPLLDAICEFLPSAKDVGMIEARNPVSKDVETLAHEEDGPLAVLVFKTSADPYVGKLTYLRVYSGTLNSDSQVWNVTKGRVERVGQLFMLRGKTQEPVARLGAGDIGVVTKLAETGTGDTLCQKDRPLELLSIVFPLPSYSAAVHPKTKADLDKLGSALSRLVEEDRTLRVRKEPDTGETILSGLGESHVEVAAEKMRRKLGVDVRLDVPKVPYKETVTISVKAEYKHKKQTGGHGQYGHVFLEIGPLPRGSGCEFAERVVGGVVPKNYIPAVEKGVVEALQEGVLAGYPVVDIKVTLYDGSYHTVDSSDIAFKIAASHALRKGISQAQPVLLEPIMNVRLSVPESTMGEVIGDLNGKRARLLGTVLQDRMSLIEAQAPLVEMIRYATELRSLTQGRGSYSMEFSHYEEVPSHIAQKVIAEAKKETEKE